MSRVRQRFVVLGLCATGAIGGCGGVTPSHAPDLTGVPLTPGARVLASVRRCDRGANAYCAVQLVVSDPSFGTSTALLRGERDHLKALGWTMANADTGDEQAADSPHHRLHLIYATAALELKGYDLGWIHRAPVIGSALSRAMFAQASALSLMLETGSS